MNEHKDNQVEDSQAANEFTSDFRETISSGSKVRNLLAIRLSIAQVFILGLALVAIFVFINNGSDEAGSISASETTLSQNVSGQIDNAVQLINEKNYESAVKILSEVIATDPSSGIALYNQGVAFQFLNRLAEAEQSYTSALSINNQDSNSYYNRGLARRDLGKLVEAETDLRIASTLKPEWAAAKFNLGQILISLDKSEEGNKLVSDAQILDPLMGK